MTKKEENCFFCGEMRITSLCGRKDLAYKRQQKVDFIYRRLKYKFEINRDLNLDVRPINEYIIQKDAPDWLKLKTLLDKNET